MSDIQTMKEMVAGLKQRQNMLRQSEAVFLKASGINEEIEKAIQERAGYESRLIESKKERDDAKAKKAVAISETMGKISEKLNAVLPFGEAAFDYSENEKGNLHMSIGWKNGDIVTSYNGLSGMQKQTFDAALANVLEADIIVVEAAEMDEENLEKTLIELAKLDKQVILNTCHKIKNIPEQFKLIEV